MRGISIRGISKSYGSVQALDSINLELKPGKIYGLLGRNGAGKTTLLNLISNRLFPDAGEIFIGQEPVLENDLALSQVYYMTEAELYPLSLQVRELLRWTGLFYSRFDMAYALELCSKFDLNIKQRVKALSTGYSSIMKAILALAAGTPIVMFDEPVLGLDANHRDLFYRELLLNYSESPRTVIISTHLIEEVADVLEEVIIIRRGKVILHKTVEELLARAYVVSGEEAVLDGFTNSKQVIGSEKLGPYKEATIMGELTEAEHRVLLDLGLKLGKPTLQRLFISLTNREGGQGNE